MNYSGFLGVIAILFLLIATGFFLRKIKLWREEDSTRLSTIVLKVCQPFMLISALASADFSYENLRSGATVFIFGLFVHALMAGVAFLLCRGFKDVDERKITEFSLIFTNTGFIGFPIMQSLFPENGLFLAAFYIISFHMVMWSWGLAILARGRSDIRLNWRRILFNFGSVPCLIGVGIYLLAIPFPSFGLPDFLVTFMNYLGNMCTPVSALITGASLATRSFKQIFGQPKTYLIACLKLLVMPLAVCVVCKGVCLICGLDPLTVALFCTVEAALPSAATITMFCEVYGLRSGYASQTVGTSALFSSVTMPLVVMAAEWFLRL